MASDYLLEIDGIKGESQDDKHKGTLELESFSWGLSQTGSPSLGRGGAAGKTVFQDFHFTKRIDSASPQLFLACAQGEHLKKAVLFVRKAGGDQQEYYKVTLTDCLVSQYQQATPDSLDTRPVDSFSMNFSKIELDYKPQSRDGSLDAPVKAGYDLAANKKI